MTVSGRRFKDAVYARRLTSDGSLPAHKTIHYVCLLGRKRAGRREIADFYNARGPQDGDDLITSSKPTGGSYLDELAAGDVMFVVHHVPTIDHVDLQPEQLREIRKTLSDLLAEGRTVLVGCSAALGRTGDALREFAAADCDPGATRNDGRWWTRPGSNR